MGDENLGASRNSDRVDLAAIPETRIGRLTLLPATRQIRRDDGDEDVVEPRVMQVLLALARAQGGIVTRDQLTDSCWDSRVVGEDAVNRVISRLRRVSEGIGADSFKIETITKIGYRLIITGETAPVSSIDRAAANPVIAQPVALARPPQAIGRRALIFGGCAAAVGTAVSYRLLHHPARTPQIIPPDAQRLLDQAEITLAQDNGDSASAAIGLLQQFTTTHPEIAQGWALLARAYAYEVHSGPGATVEAMRQRASEAAQRALEIDPSNATARIAKVIVLPRQGNWAKKEIVCRKALAKDPNNVMALSALEKEMGEVGRCRERAMLIDREIAPSNPTPDILYRRVVALWSAGRLEEADRAMAAAFAVAPRHYAIWFTRFYLLLYTGRISQAIGFAQDIDGRASGIATEEFEDVIKVAQAMLTHDPALVAQVTQHWLEKARKGAGHAENAMQFLSTLGKLDEAFAVADACYFNRGFTVADVRFSQTQGGFMRLHDRRTTPLFFPSTKAMRGDPRFARLVDEIGLEKYWREMGVQPDYRIVGNG